MFIRNTLKNGKETLQTEGQARRCQESPNKRKAEITILMSHGLELKVRGTKRNREGTLCNNKRRFMAEKRWP